MGVLRITGASPLKLLFGKPAKRKFSCRMSDVGLASDVMKVDTLQETKKTAGAVYTANLAKLIPGEAFAIYALGQDVQVPASVANAHVLPIVCLVAAMLFRWLATRRSGGSMMPQWSALFVAGVSFVLWVYTQNDWFWTWKIPEQFMHVVKYIMILWIFAIPAVMGDTRAEGAGSE